MDLAEGNGSTEVVVDVKKPNPKAEVETGNKHKY